MQRGVADADDALDRDRREQADLDRVLDVHGVGEAAGEVDPVDLVGGHAQAAEQDPLAAGVGGLGLGEQARVRAREGDALLRRDEELVEAVTEPTLLVHPARATELGQDVDEPRAADADRLDVADRPEREAVTIERTVSMAPSAPGIPKRSRPPSKAGPAGHEAARKRVPSVTTTSVFVPMSMSIRMPSPAGEVDRDEVGRGIAADVTGDDRRADHAAVRVHEQPDLVAAPAQPGRVALRRPASRLR